MARHVRLTWTNAYLVDNTGTIPGLSQEVERKIGEGDWEETLIEPVEGEGGAFAGIDEDLEDNGETVEYMYRVVTINGDTRALGNVITVEVLENTDGLPPVEDLDGEYVPDEDPAEEP